VIGICGDDGQPEWRAIGSCGSRPCENTIQSGSTALGRRVVGKLAEYGKFLVIEIVDELVEQIVGRGSSRRRL
jgi:hypothetical protein